MLAVLLLANEPKPRGWQSGSTIRLGEHAVDSPVDFPEIVATIYHNLRIDPLTTTLVDPNGQPQFLLDKRDLMREGCDGSPTNTR